MVYTQKRIYLNLLLVGVIIGFIALFLLYAFNWTSLVDVYQTQEGSLGVILIIGIRILFLSLMTIYTFYSWFQQEKQYFSDIPFLFGIFFLLLIFGKFLDLFIDFIYYQAEETVFLLFTKTRLFIIILDFFPMIYLSVGMILFSLSLREKFHKLSNKVYSDKIKNIALIVIIIAELVAIIVSPNITILSIIIPIIVIPSLLTIIWLFSFAHRNKRLSQVNSLILAIGFGLYLLSQIIRPIVQFVIGLVPLFIIIAEAIDLIVFIVIFIGFYKKANYIETT